MFCQKCGAPRAESDVRCGQCGADLAAGLSTGPPFVQPASGMGPRPANYLVWSILATLFCCLPAGVVSIIYAAQVDNRHNMGDYAGSVDSSNKARMWAWISFGVGIAGMLIYALIFGLASMSLFPHVRPVP